jgi:superfamily I DNA/RNA helicase
MVGDNQNRTISYIINKIKKEVKDKPLLLSKVKNIESFLAVLGINWRKIPRFQQIVEQFDQERNLNEERKEENLTEEDINEFIQQIDEQLTEKDIENTGKTILSTIHKAKGLEFDYVFLIGTDEGILPSETKKQEAY